MILWILIFSGALHVLTLGVLTLVRYFRPSPPEPEQFRPLSVIIAAHNETHNLQHFLPAVLEQDYSGEYEVVVVLDRCTDNSESIVEALQLLHPNLRYLRIDEVPAGWSPKKHALRSGIEAARHARLAFTDADCVPEPGWLTGVNAHFETGADLILGQGPYFPRPGLLNLLIRFETHMTALLYMGAAALGLPYMGVGRNLAYKREFFDEAGGFGRHARRLSGDDDLLVNHHARKARIGLLDGRGTLVWSEPEKQVGRWIRQKLRHLSAGAAYRPVTQLILSAVHGLHAIFYLSLVGALFFEGPADMAGIAYLLRTVSMIALLRLSKGLPAGGGMLLLYPVLDLVYLLYLIFLTPAGLVVKPKWKGK